MYLTCGFKSIYFSLLNCFSTLHVICLTVSFVLASDINEPGWEGSQNENGAKPGQPARWTGARMVHASESPHSLLAKTRDCCWDKTRSWVKELGARNTRGTEQSPGAGHCHLAYGWQKAEGAVAWHAEEAPWCWPTGRCSAPSKPRTGTEETYNPILLFKENESVHASTHSLPSLTPLLCHLLFLGQSMSQFMLTRQQASLSVCIACCTKLSYPLWTKSGVSKLCPVPLQILSWNSLR